VATAAAATLAAATAAATLLLAVGRNGKNSSRISFIMS
jgi:hypothetical protein